MRIKFFFFIVICLVQFGCNKNNSKNRAQRLISTEVIDINIESLISVSDLFSKIEVIPLETTSKSIIKPHYIKILPVGEDYYVLDIDQQMIFIFDSKGKFKKEINKIGEGPKEYIYPVDFSINPFTGNLEILSNYSYLQIYDIEGINHIKKIRLPGSISNCFANLTEDIYVIYSDVVDDEKAYFFSKSKNEILGHAYDFPKYILMHTSFHHIITPFYSYGDTIRFTQAYNGDVYTVNKDDFSFDLHYHWNFGNNTLEESLLIPIREDPNYYTTLWKSGNNKYAMHFLWNGEISNYFITNFIYRNRQRALIYNKSNKNIYTFNEFAEGGTLMPFYMDEEAMYTWGTPDYLHVYVNDKILDEANRRKLNEIDDDDNTVVIKYTFK